MTDLTPEEVARLASATPTVSREHLSPKAIFRMDAYYYEFDMTGVHGVDLVLSAVACAGKAFHQTECWTDDIAPYHDGLRGSSPVDWIQNAAKDVAALIAQQAAEIASKDAEIERLRARVAELMRIPESDIGWDADPGEHYVEVGPTPLRGRITRRTT